MPHTGRVSRPTSQRVPRGVPFGRRGYAALRLRVARNPSATSADWIVIGVSPGGVGAFLAFVEYRFRVVWYRPRPKQRSLLLPLPEWLSPLGGRISPQLCTS